MGLLVLTAGGLSLYSSLSIMADGTTGWTPVFGPIIMGVAQYQCIPWLLDSHCLKQTEFAKFHQFGAQNL